MKRKMTLSNIEQGAAQEQTTAEPAEVRRLTALRSYEVLDTPPEAALDDLVQLAAGICGAPTALISLVDEQRQWFKAKVGHPLTETPLEDSFCAKTLYENGVAVIPDLTLDPRFADSPLVTCEHGLRFYASAPLITPDGERLGKLCVADQVPHTLTGVQEQALHVLSQQAMTHLELRRHALETARRERLLNAIFEAEPECVSLLGRDGTVRLINPAGLRILEADSMRQALTCSLVPLVSDEHRTAFLKLIARVFQGESGQMEFRMTGLRGIERCMEIHAVPLRDGQGKITDFLSIIRDVTESKEAQEALRKSEASLAAAQALAHLGSWERNLLTREETWSAEMKRLHGLDLAAEIPGYEAFLKLVHPTDRSAISHLRDEVMKQKGPVSYRYRTNPALGPVCYFDATTEVIRDGFGQPVQLSGTVLNVTERERYEARLQRLLDSNSQGMYFWNTQGDVTSGNDAFLQLIGYNRDELQAGAINWKELTPAEFAEADEALLRELAETGRCRPFEKEYSHKDGTRVPVLIAASMFEDNPQEGVCFVFDLTDRKKLEQQFLRSQRMDSIGTLAGGIAHDLNNALGPILMSLDILMSRFADSDSQELLEIIRTCAQRGADMVRQVLSFARGIEGQRLLIQPLHLIKEIVQIAQETFPKSIRIHEKSSGPIWNIDGDPTHLHQVLLNLCVNARDAMLGGGEISLSVENHSLDEHGASMLPDARPGAYVVVRVEDNGSGIPRTVIDRIFDPFFTTKDQGKGTGLGLSTVQAIVRSHGGFVSVASEVGRGTVFSVYLPAAAGEMEVHPTAEHPATAHAGRGELILMIDDETSLLTVTRAVLEKHGYRVLTAESGAEAISIFAREKDEVRLVLVDVVMPVLDGPMVVRTLKKMQPQIRVIASSGHAEERQLAELRNLGVSTILAKPFLTEKLIESVSQALSA